MISPSYNIIIKEIPSFGGVLVYDVGETHLKGLSSLKAGSPFFMGFLTAFLSQNPQKNN